MIAEFLVAAELVATDTGDAIAICREHNPANGE